MIHRRRRDGRDIARSAVRMAERAGQHDHDGDDPGEDRPVDEEARQQRALLDVVGGDGARPRVRLRRLRPLHDQPVAGAEAPTSPATCRPTVWPTVSWRSSRRPGRSTTSAVGWPFWSRLTPCCGARMPAGLTPSMTVRAHVHARQQHAGGIGEDRAQRHRAGGLVDRDVGELQLAGERIGRAVIQRQVRLARSRRAPRSPALGHLAAQRQHLGARLVDVDIDRIERWMVASAVVWLAVTSAPCVTVEAPMRPVIGAVMRV